MRMRRRNKKRKIVNNDTQTSTRAIMRMRRRKKKSKTVNNIARTSTKEKYNFVEFPLDLVFEILRRLPAKSVARFLAVSKIWATCIRSREFITSFPFGSSSQPRTLIALPVTNELQDWHLLSLSSSSTFFLSHVPYLPLQEYSHNHVNHHHVNGLISLGYGAKQIVSNPSTGTYITLPRVKTKTTRWVIKSFFGYDSGNDQYKVLCMTENLYDVIDPSCQHQVFTLGASKSWKMIDCSIHHRPWTNGVCIDSAVYYVAKTGVVSSHLSLMRFDLRSESFSLVSGLPPEMPNHRGCISDDILINYRGKVARPIQTTLGTFDVWIMDQDSDKHEWSKKITFSVELSKCLAGKCFFGISFTGITHTGEFILASSLYYNDVYYVFHYNPDMDRFRRFEFRLSGDYIDYYKFRPNWHRSSLFMIFSDYVETVRLL